MVKLKQLLSIITVLICIVLSIKAYGQDLPTHNFQIDWSKMKLEVIGTGNIISKAKGNFIEWQMVATIEAEDNLIKNCVVAMSKLRVDAYNSAKDILSIDQDASQKFYNSINNVKRHIIRYRENSVIINMELPFFGDNGIANIFVRAGTDLANFHKYDEYAYSTSFTGLVIDARSLKRAPAIAPRIFDENHNTIYSIDFIEEEYFKKWGCVQYTCDPYYREFNDRVGEKPYRIVAIENDKLIDTDIAISNENAMVLLQNKTTWDYLKQGRVIIIIDSENVERKWVFKN